MSLIGLLRLPTRRRDPRPTPRRRPSSLTPTLEGLEVRLVLSHAASTIAAHHHGPAEIQAMAVRASQQIRVPINLTGIDITSITRDATTGALNLVGTATGTILGQTFTTPLSGTVTPARNARACPVLNLHLEPINLSVLGLNVNTSAICLNINARRGGGLLGNLLCGGLSNVLTSAGNGSTTQATTQLNTLLDNTQLLSALNRPFSRAGARLASFTPAQGNTCPVLDLSLGPIRLNLLGLNVKLDNCQNGPVRVNVSATQGGGLLGDLVCGLTGGAGRALTRQVGGVLQQITAHGPSVA